MCNTTFDADSSVRALLFPSLPAPTSTAALPSLGYVLHPFATEFSSLSGFAPVAVFLFRFQFYGQRVGWDTSELEKLWQLTFAFLLSLQAQGPVEKALTRLREVQAVRA